ALFVASLLGRFVKQNPSTNEKGIVQIWRSTAWNLKAHAWVLYKPEEKESPLYLIDSTMPHTSIYNLNEKEDVRAVLDAYKKRNLEGILEDLFATLSQSGKKFPPHPEMQAISEEACALIP